MILNFIELLWSLKYVIIITLHIRYMGYYRAKHKFCLQWNLAHACVWMLAMAWNRPKYTDTRLSKWGLRVLDNIEWLPKLYRRKVLAVLYSYDNKECVRAKHIMIKLSFVLWKEKIQDQIISSEQVKYLRYC
jgi:hypothetical protein